jgi:hypothetical protein
MSQNKTTTTAQAQLAELLAAGRFTLNTQVALEALAGLDVKRVAEDFEARNVVFLVDDLREAGAIVSPHPAWDVHAMDINHGEDVLFAVENWADGNLTAGASFLRLTSLADEIHKITDFDSDALGAELSDVELLAIAQRAVDGANAAVDALRELLGQSA